MAEEDALYGCYGLRCKDCELFTPTTLDNEECRRRRALALKKLNEDEQ
jgi:hypothetical protein